MQLPIKAHYATVAMLALAQQYEIGGLMTARSMAAEHDIPSQFLIQILQQLRAAGMVSSTRGSNGGFKLERSPATISVADILGAVCPLSSAPNVGQSTLSNVVQELWSQLDAIESQYLRRLKLSHLLQRAACESESMFYI